MCSICSLPRKNSRRVSKTRAPTRLYYAGRLDRTTKTKTNMPNYLCVQRSLPGGETSKPSPAQMQEMYAAFGAWQEKFKKNLIDMGGRLGDGRLVTAESSGDGPFVEVKELVGGYMIVAADSLDEAIEVASGCPGLVGPGSGVEVIEVHGP